MADDIFLFSDLTDEDFDALIRFGFKLNYYAGSPGLPSVYEFYVPNGWIIKTIENEHRYKLYFPKNILKYTISFQNE